MGTESQTTTPRQINEKGPFQKENSVLIIIFEGTC